MKSRECCCSDGLAEPPRPAMKSPTSTMMMMMMMMMVVMMVIILSMGVRVSKRIITTTSATKRMILTIPRGLMALLGKMMLT